jgi:hypothetical protein
VQQERAAARTRNANVLTTPNLASSRAGTRLSLP